MKWGTNDSATLTELPCRGQHQMKLKSESQTTALFHLNPPANGMAIVFSRGLFNRGPFFEICKFGNSMGQLCLGNVKIEKDNHQPKHENLLLE